MRRPAGAGLLTALALAALAGSHPAMAGETGYYAQPALHGDTLVFASEGDLWIAALDGDLGRPITAWRLTSGDGQETDPRISPDGSTVAFAGAYDGNTDVYVVPIDGGAPRRLTFHPDADRPLDWTRDGSRILFRSPRANPHGHDEAWVISRAGGMPRPEAYGLCSMLAHSASGRRIAMTPFSVETRHWKGYRGGTAPDIWVGDPMSGAFQRLTKDPATDQHPMWVAGRVFFLSDRAGTFNLFSDRPEGGDVRQHTHFAYDAVNPAALDGYDARWASADSARGEQRIAFCQGGALVLYDARADTATRLDVRIASDRTAARDRYVPVGDSATRISLSPDASTVLVEARGELVAVDVASGEATQVTRTSGAREWSATWLDDDRVACISDGAGEHQVAVAPIDGSTGARLVTDDRTDWLLTPVAGPDGKWIAFADQTMRLHALDLTTLERHEVDRAEAGEITDYRFSPDGRWIAYVKPLANGHNQIVLHALRSRRNFPIGDGSYSDSSPTWSPDGKYVFYLSERAFDPILGWFDYEHVYANTTLVFALPLEKSVPPPIPALLRAAGVGDEDADQGAGAETDAVEVEAVAVEDGVEDEPGLLIDTDDLAARSAKLAVPAGNYTMLRAQDGGLTFLSHPIAGLQSFNPLGAGGLHGGNATLRRFDLEKEEVTTVAEGVSEYDVNAGGSHVLATDAQGPFVKPLAGGEAERFAFDGLRVRIDPRPEWTQVLNEAWRLQRDFYWAPTLGGVNWEAQKTRYAALLPRIGTRAELNDVVAEMIGELRTSHAYVMGGALQEHERARPVNVGLLGVDVAVVNGRHVIERILPRHDWADDLESPLAQPYVRVSAGDVIVSVNGRALGPADNLYDALQDQAGRLVALEVTGPDGRSGRHTVHVEALGSELAVRYQAWIDKNRAYVAERTNGAAGYVHIPNMMGDGLAQFSRQFYPQYQRTGLIVDVRDNNGGFVSQMILACLARTVHGFGQPREGVTERYPARALNAHLVALIDEQAGSDGDIFPAMFRAMRLGPLIGTRTWGGVVGIMDIKPTIDLGVTTQPQTAWWDFDGWSIENHGVDPDIEVVVSPQDRAMGVDPQLERAIDEVVARLARDPKALPEHPVYPR